MRKFHSYLGEKIAYEIVGKGQTLVLIHGFLGSRNSFKPLIQRLKNQYKVLSIDLPGHGDSSPIGYVHDMELLADLLKSLLDKNRLRRVFLIGHSLGGYVTLAFAEKYPDQLKGLVLLNSTATADSTMRLKSRNQLIELIKKDREKAIGLLIPSFFQGDSQKTKRLIRDYKKEARRCSTRGIIASIEGMKKRVDREIVLKFAPYPYLVLIGENDGILDTDQQILEGSLGEEGRYEILENSSHMSFLELPGKVYNSLRRFVREVNG